MTTLIIKTNPAQGTDVLIRDMGIPIPSDHTTPGTTDIETFTDKRNISDAGDSVDLESLLTDDVHGADSSTLILNVDGNDVPQPLIPPTLSSLAAEGTSASVDNLSAIVDPTLTDDDAAGYKQSSWWVNTLTQRTPPAAGREHPGRDPRLPRHRRSACGRDRVHARLAHSRCDHHEHADLCGLWR